MGSLGAAVAGMLRASPAEVPDLKPRVTDVHRTLRYSHEKMARKFLLIGVPAFFIGLYGMFEAHDFARQPMYWLGLAAGGFCIGYGFYRTANPGELLVLSPAGIRIHIDMVKHILIPWCEIHGVDRIDIETSHRGIPVTIAGVTAVLVPQHFYDRVIHVDSMLLRGPGWENLFIPKGDMVQVVLPHQNLRVKAEDLHAAVEARWLAFRAAEHAEERV
jgi:hypothetical protein